jgi:hypothetical protein
MLSSTHANELMRLKAKLVDTSWWLGRLPLEYTTASGIDSVLSVSCFHGRASVSNDIVTQQVPPKRCQLHDFTSKKTTKVLCEASPCGICGGQSGTATGF